MTVFVVLQIPKEVNHLIISKKKNILKYPHKEYFNADVLRLILDYKWYIHLFQKSVLMFFEKCFI